MDNYLNKFKLDGKKSYVIGGAGLIGTEISKAVASAGSETVILDVNSSKSISICEELNDNGFCSNYEDFDCTDLERLEIIYEDIIKKYGCPDIFINCSYPRTDDYKNNNFKEINFKSYRTNVDINMNSQIWLAYLTAELMVKYKKEGKIIQFSSIYGVVGQDTSLYEGTEVTENMTYSVAKGGIINFTRQMASYYGKYQILVNTICPGAVSGHVPGVSNKQSKILVDNLTKRIPLKRLAQPQEIASTTLFLASSASSYITGSTLIVDGGWTAI